MDNELEKTKPISYEELANLEKNLDGEKEIDETEDTINALDSDTESLEESEPLEENDNNEELPLENSDEVNTEEETKEKKPKKKGSKKVLFIVLGVIAFILLIAGLVFLAWRLIFKKDKKKTDKPKDVIVEIDNYRYQNGTLIFLDGKDEIGSYDCENKSTKNCYLADFSNEEDDFFNSRQVYEDLSPVPNKSTFIDNKYAFVIDSKSTKETKVIIYDMKNKKKIDTVDSVKYYNVDGKVIVRKKDKYGVYNLDSKDHSLVVPIEYNYLGVITENKETNNLIVAKKDSDWSLISYDNKSVTKAVKEPIKDYNSEYIISGKDNTYLIYDYKGNIVINDTYEFIKLLDEYVLVVSDSSLYVKDYEGNSFTGDGIKLSSKDYIPKYVYDKNGSLLKIVGSFVSEYQDNTIKIKDINKDKNYTVNLMEGVVNRKYKYLNYFNGYLYFYSDEAKTNLVGSYKCSNKNEITDLNSVFDSCYPASDSAYEKNDVTNNEGKTGVIPIINNRYLFVKDGTSVKMYDFSRNKVIGQYQNVSTYYFTGSEDLSFVTTNELDIIARNNSSKMGLIRLVNGEITSGIDFNYLSLEKIGSYYLAKNSNAKYQLIYSNDGSKVSKEFSGVIKGFNDNYLKIKENNKYYLYDYDGNKVNTSGAKYIELYDKFYFLVDDSNELTVYNYENEQIISDTIKLYNSRYTDLEKPAFKMNLENDILTISVLSSENYLDYHYDITTGDRVEG